MVAIGTALLLLAPSMPLAELPPDAIPPIAGRKNHSGRKPERIDITPAPLPQPQPERPPRIDIPPPPPPPPPVRPPVRKPPVQPKGLQYDENDQQIELFYYYVE